jgi:hypothetical protein
MIISDEDSEKIIYYAVFFDSLIENVDLNLTLIFNRVRRQDGDGNPLKEVKICQSPELCQEKSYTKNSIDIGFWCSLLY